MLYPFMKYFDGTDIVVSDIFFMEEDDNKHIKVFFERVDKTGEHFDSMECVLPGAKMQNVKGFTESEVKMFTEKIKRYESMIFEWSEEEGHY